MIRKLLPEEIECRVAQVTAKGCSLLLYKTARVDRAILEETYGELWQNDFKVIDGKMYGGIGIFNKELNQWLWRWDCGTESNQDAEKGQASDCFKRAGFKWGIGIELYTAPFIWYSCETVPKGNGKYELANRFTKFYVKNISYNDAGAIKDLSIINDEGKVVYKMGKKADKPEAKTTNDDADIYILLYKIDDIEAVKSYYDLNKEKVIDREKFHKECEKQVKAIRDIMATELEEVPF